MNVTNLMSAMQNQGMTSPPQEHAEGSDSQDLLSFLTSLTQQLQTTPQSTETDTTTQISPDDLQALTEKIAAMLQDGKPLPASLQSLTPDDLATQIAEMLQKTNGISCIQSSLKSDLAAFLSSEIQETIPKDNISQKDIIALLNEIHDLIAKNSDPTKIPSFLQTQDTSAPTDTTLLLQQLKDKIAQLSTTTDETGNDALLQLTEELILFLKENGIEQPVIEHQLAVLTKFLGQEKPLTPVVTSTTTLAQTPTLPAGNTETLAHTTAQQNATKSTTPHQPQAATPTQNTEPPQQQPLTARIAGLGISSSTLHAMTTTGDGGFSSDGFGSQTGGQQQGLASDAKTLSPFSVDTLNTQNFTNYLTSARSQPSPLTQMVNLQLQRGINSRIESMTLQLEPAELGRLDIKLKFGKDGKISAHMTVDKPETLALLQKDSPHLEKILQQTGLDADENSLSFDLRQQSNQQSTEEYDSSNGDADEFAAHINGTSAEKTLQAQIAMQTNGYITQSGVNIMV